jgi:redox-sensitive bicupin YhaK (pirin superfamily)
MSNINEHIKIRRPTERGTADHGWLKSHFTFSFAEYFDPQHMGYRSLRVINDDIIDGGQGFGMHPHRDMEIISYVVEGELEHKDNMGNGSVIKAGDLQKMSAGTGVTHSEFNPSSKKTRLIQIWILPDQKGLKPSYQELKASDLKSRSGLILVGSSDPKDRVIHISQDVKLYLGLLNPGQKAEYVSAGGRGVWVQLIKGQLEFNDIVLESGDGVSIEYKDQLCFGSPQGADFLLFDLA